MYGKILIASVLFLGLGATTQAQQWSQGYGGARGQHPRAWSQQQIPDYSPPPTATPVPPSAVAVPFQRDDREHIELDDNARHSGGTQMTPQ